MKKERIMTVTVLTGNKDEDRIKELKDLVESTNGEVVSEISQSTNINPATYIGSGKLNEIRNLVKIQDIDTLVFNNELSGSQIRNIEDIVDCKVIDRTGLILDIFAKRARTRGSKLQIKLAQLEYRLPRLVGFRNYLSKEGAGIGTRGPGEQKLETDRRAIEREIHSIKEELKNIKRARTTSQKLRKTSSIDEIALVGYSNAGKSTILNQMIKLRGSNDKKVYSDDRLFATLDTAVRRINYDNIDLIISDTVGFVSDLPDKLKDAFSSTFEELNLADLILLVIDVSSVDYMMQIKATKDALKDLDIDFDKIIFVYNKMDKIKEDFFVDKNENYIKISAKNDDDIFRLLEKIVEEIYGTKIIIEIFFSYKDIGKYESLKDSIEILEEKYTNEGVEARVSYRIKEVIKW